MVFPSTAITAHQKPVFPDVPCSRHTVWPMASQMTYPSTRYQAAYLHHKEFEIIVAYGQTMRLCYQADLAGMHINPRNVSWGNVVMALANVTTALGKTPDFCGSLSIFT